MHWSIFFSSTNPEVDHVGEVAKVAVRNAIASGSVFGNSKEIVTFLEDKFSYNGKHA